MATGAEDTEADAPPSGAFGRMAATDGKVSKPPKPQRLKIPEPWHHRIVFTITGRTEMYLQVTEAELDRISSLNTQSARYFSLAGACIGIAIGLIIDAPAEAANPDPVAKFLGTWGVWFLLALSAIFALWGLRDGCARQSEINEILRKHGDEREDSGICRAVNFFRLKKPASKKS